VGWLFGSPPWRETSIWSLDLELSGLDPVRNDILSVGMVPIRAGVIRWGERYYTLVRTPADHRPSSVAMAIHHILPEEAEHAPQLAQVVDEIRARIAEGPMLVHYGRLDVAFLKRSCARLGVPWPRPTIIDTVRLLSRLSYRRRQLDPYVEAYSADLGAARSEMGLPNHVAHHALYDALATAELFLVLAERLGARLMRHLR
jgi:DNA polymerase III subunit epsilon